MPVAPTYPGVYIEEVPSTSHSITAAPTSVTVFVGYTHPFKTKARNVGAATQLFSFAEYEREFGGFHSSGLFSSDVAFAVNQFFLNGGSIAYVVGLQPKYRTSAGAVVNPSAVVDPEADLSTLDPATVMNPTGRFPSPAGASIIFYGLEPADLPTLSLQVKITPKADPTVADIEITYGPRAETYRGVKLGSTTDENHIAKRINGVSNLVVVGPDKDNGYPASFTQCAATPLVGSVNMASVAGTFLGADFTDAMEAETALDKVGIFNLMVIPGIADNTVLSTALAFCERKRAFLIMDPPADAVADSGDAAAIDKKTVPLSANGALYFPYLRSTDPLTSLPKALPPSGYVAGLYARTDTRRGVWKAPAGVEASLLGTPGVVATGRMTDMRQGVLNPKGVNCLRDFPGTGTVIYGARTLVTANPAFEQFRYVPVRRMTLFIEQTLYANLKWVVFEPNDHRLWAAIRSTINAFMLSLYNQGAFFGTTPSKAFVVTCDETTTTQQDIDQGIVNIVVGFCPLKPAEFVIVKISHLAGQTQA